MTAELSEKCNGCGASVVFEPEKSGLYCQHCEAVVAIESPVAPRNPLALIEQKKAALWDDTVVFECTSCGAQEVLHGSAMAQSCAFCGSSNINRNSADAGQRPDAIVPFKISKPTAIERLKAWVKKKVFAPRKFKKNIEPREMDGVYNPVFTFDAQTFTQYRGVISRVVVRSTGRSTYSYTERRNIAGNWNSSFSEITITACDTISQGSFSSMGRFSTNGARAFRSPYIFGFAAGQYKKDGTASWAEARGIMEKQIRQQVASQYPGWTLESFSGHTTYNNPTYRYMLLPIYIGHLKYKEKRYNFYMNGETGLTAGKTPVSGLKVAALACGILLGAAAIIVPILLSPVCLGVF